MRASGIQICGPFGGILWLDEFSKLLLNKMDFRKQTQKFMKAPAANLLMASKIFKRLAVVFPEQQKSRQPEQNIVYIYKHTNTYVCIWANSSWKNRHDFKMFL